VSVLIQKHLDALEASMRLGLAQIEAARHAMDAPKPAPVQKDSVARCADIPEGQCAKVDGLDARFSRETFGDPAAWKCKGCRKSHEEIAAA